MSRLAALTVALAVAGVSLTGCVTAPGPQPGPSYSYPYSSDILDESRGSPDAPQEFMDRTPYPPCPDVMLEQGEEIPEDAVACIEHAGPEGAELAVVRPTTEGDPYVMFYRVGHGINGLEIWEDATRDAFGGGWHVANCSVLSVLTPGDCEYRDF
jgi:hypothetical protein